MAEQENREEIENQEQTQAQVQDSEIQKENIQIEEDLSESDQNNYTMESETDENTEEAEETCEEDSSASEKEVGNVKEKKGFFGKKKEKKDKKDQEIEELTDKYKRTLAEFDNFRKRTEKEKSQMYEIGAKDVIEKILPVLDNFERGFASISEEEKAAPFAEGMEKIYKQFVKTLEEIGVTPIEAVGKEFNPEFHNAVMRGEDEELGENIISEEFQKGYLYRSSVVRHSMVKVVNC